MKEYYLQIKSKNEKSLQNFVQFFFKHLKIKFKIFPTLTSNQNSKKKITILKSPHVYKTSQEHFETRVFSKKVVLKSFYLKTNIIFLKKVLKI